MRNECRSLPCITKVKSTLFLIFVHWLCSLMLIYLDSFIISCKCYFMVKGSVTHLNQEQTCIFFSVLLVFYTLKQFTSRQQVVLYVIVIPAVVHQIQFSYLWPSLCLEAAYSSTYWWQIHVSLCAIYVILNDQYGIGDGIFLTTHKDKITGARETFYLNNSMPSSSENAGVVITSEVNHQRSPM